jgi:hypothetical protein
MAAAVAGVSTSRRMKAPGVATKALLAEAFCAAKTFHLPAAIEIVGTVTAAKRVESARVRQVTRILHEAVAHHGPLPDATAVITGRGRAVGS